ncbi:MAG TPA: MFS transporter [Gammaproteobacteria bacterium]|jgi:YNFM family putative membrane transporter|nr:MFS transporter [Gammaproteobacteria bacterium]
MTKREKHILLVTACLAFCALYAPQPILPGLAAHFGVSHSQISLLISASLLPLGLAPILYGYLIEAVPARLLLFWALLILAVSQIAFAFANDYSVLLASRIVQGFCFPAIFTAVTTYFSAAAEQASVRRVMSTYVATTIVGGFAGRFSSGLISDIVDWRATFVVLGLALFACMLAIAKLPATTRIDFSRIDIRAAKRVLEQGVFRHGLLTIFFAFFVFAAMLNGLPFRLKDIDPTISDLMIALVYAGYIYGVMIAVSSARISQILGGDISTMRLGAVLLAIATAAFGATGVLLSLLNMLLFVTGMFLIHAVLAGYLNHQAAENKGMLNGLYISFYYLGGAAGSWLPTLIYGHYGWSAFIGGLLVLCGACVVSIERLGKAKTINR